MLSALKDGIVRTTYESWASYLGWRPYGTTSPRDEPFLIGALIAPPAHEVPQAPAVPDPPGGPAWFPPVPEDGNDR